MKIFFMVMYALFMIVILESAKVLKKIAFVVFYAIGCIVGVFILIENLVNFGFDKVIDACESELGIKEDEEIDPKWEVPS